MIRWLIDFFQGGLDNVTKKETERDFAEVLNALQAAPDYVLGALLCCLTCLRLGYEEHGDVPRELFALGDNPAKNRSKIIQSNFSVTVHRNFARKGDRTARMAELILLCSIRAVAYPEFVPKATEMWTLLRRGQSKAGMEATVECAFRANVPDPVAIITQTCYFPPVFEKEVAASM